MQTGRGRRGLIAATFAFLTLASLAHAEVPIVIDDDHGGVIDTFVMWYKRLAASDTPVILRGVCESACTLVLSLPSTQVCVEPTASLGFHLATVDDRPAPSITRAVSRRFYPQSVLDWLKNKTLTDVPIYMSAETIVKLGIFPPCVVVEAVVPAEPRGED